MSFDLIYQTVLKATDFNRLQKQLKDLYIDVRKEHKPFITVAAQLALDGKDDRVEWMRRLGANPGHIVRVYAQMGKDLKVVEYRDNYDVGIAEIVEGYALAGNHEKVKLYLSLWNADIDSVAYAYAQAENHNKVKECLDAGADIGAIAEGYAVVANHDAVLEYQNLGVDINEIVAMYALAGNHQKVDEYLVSYPSEISVDTIARCYAEAGYDQQVEEYQVKYYADPNLIVEMYAEVGNHLKVEEYRTVYKVDVDFIASGYARGGNHNKVKEYYQVHKACSEKIAQAYNEAGYFKKYQEYSGFCEHSNSSPILGDEDEIEGEQVKKELYNLLSTYKEKRSQELDFSNKIKEYLHGNFFTFFQKSFTQKCQAIDVLSRALENKSVDLRPHLSTLRNGNLGKDLRRFIKEGKANSLFSKPVTTVSDFVEELQKKVAPWP
jgi:hypothetical protein